jgi:phosphatidylglycerophosphate synthase
MIDNSFRKILPRFVRPVIVFCARKGVHPSVLTIFGLTLAFCAAFAIANGNNILALFFWLSSRMCDGLDGILARHLGLTSAFGSYLDIVCDLASYSAIIFGFYFLYPHLSFYWILILCGYVLCITSALALGMQEQLLNLSLKDNRGLRLGAGLAEGGETLIAYVVFLCFPSYIEQSVIVWSFVVFLTVFFRTKLAYKILSP